MATKKVALNRINRRINQMYDNDHPSNHMHTMDELELLSYLKDYIVNSIPKKQVKRTPK